MPIVSFGVNHKTASLGLREQLCLSKGGHLHSLQGLINTSAVNEAVLLSTCNRTEIYADTGDPRTLAQWLGSVSGVNEADFSSSSYYHYGAGAVAHLLRVASGLDSMMLGEPQILGQLKRAFFDSDQSGLVGTQFRQLFPWVFSVTKKIRTQTELGKSPVSMAYAVVQLAKTIFSDMGQVRVLLVGAGEMMELMATHLQQQGVRQMVVANRTLEKANSMVTRYDAHAIRIGDVPAYMGQVDMTVTATASQLPIIGKGMMETVSKQRRHKPMLMVDLAVPRDIEPEVASLPDVYLFNIDDLQKVIANNLKSREKAAKQAEAIVEIQTRHYLQTLKVMEAGDLIRRFRSQVERYRDDEIVHALHELNKGVDSQLVVTSLARTLTQQFLHQPTKVLRQAAYEERVEIIELIKELYDLS